MIIRWIGKDANGIPRVYGEAPTPDIAEARCMDAAKDYVRHRPDTAPLSMWAFERETPTLGQLLD